MKNKMKAYALTATSARQVVDYLNEYKVTKDELATILNTDNQYVIIYYR